MPTHTGKEGLVKVGTNTIAEIKSFSFEQSAETADDTSLGDDWRTFKPTLRTWNGSIECHWDETDSTGQGALTIGTEVNLDLFPEGNSTGDVKFSGAAIITGISRQVTLDGIISATYTFQGSGALTQGTV